MNLNKVIIVGRITQQPELKALPTGIKVCSFSVATNEYFKNKDGVKQEKTEFHNIVCFGATAENIAKFMDKGNEIMIEGKLQTRNWEIEGVKKYRTEILAQTVQFGSKPQESNQKASAVAKVENNSEEVEYPTDDINPEDIPF